MGDSPQVEAIKESANKIEKLIKGNLITIANDLKWVKLLTDQDYDEIVDTRGNPPLQRANTLIQSVIAQVEVDPAQYEVFRGVLEKHLNPEVLRKILPKLDGDAIPEPVPSRPPSQQPPQGAPGMQPQPSISQQESSLQIQLAGVSQELHPSPQPLQQVGESSGRHQQGREYSGIKDLHESCELHVLSANVAETPDPSSYWRLQEHCKYKGRGTTITVVDTGIQKDHPAFTSVNCLQFVACASLPCVDTNGHGTFCAGVACGAPSRWKMKDGSIVTCCGVAPEATLVVYKAYERTTWYVVQALQQIVAKLDSQTMKLDVLVMASGFPDKNPELHQAIKELDKRGVIVVCAASNVGAMDSSAIYYPARFSETICIGSHNRYGNRSQFSPVGDEMEFLALGEDVMGPIPVSTWKIDSGTSFAAPAIGGLICLILEAVADQCGDKVTKIHNSDTIKKLLRMLTSEGPHNNEYGFGSIKRDKVKTFFSDPKHFITRLEHNRCI